MINCKAASRLASERLERPLGFWEGLQLRLHLAYCSGCRRMAGQFKFLRKATSTWMNHEN